MNFVGARLVLANSTPLVQSVSDTSASARAEASARFMHHRHGWRGIIGGVIWIAVVVYVLWLATRVVRAIERLADRSQGRP
jgi:hypothetical protein